MLYYVSYEGIFAAKNLLFSGSGKSGSGSNRNKFQIHILTKKLLV